MDIGLGRKEFHTEELKKANVSLMGRRSLQRITGGYVTYCSEEHGEELVIHSMIRRGH